MDMERDKWGDNQLSAQDLSAAFLSSKADWRRFFQEKGFEDPYPMVLYKEESAEEMHDELMEEMSRWHGYKDVGLDVYTRFEGSLNESEAADRGLLLLCVRGARHLRRATSEDILWLWRSGADAWAREAYDDEEVATETKWVDANELDEWEWAMLSEVRNMCDEGTEIYPTRLTKVGK